jgi:hypothetical protein
MRGKPSPSTCASSDLYLPLDGSLLRTSLSAGAPFFLKSDLTRHKLNVHRGETTQEAQPKIFVCPSERCKLCATPFTCMRKDNFERHVRKCK